MQLWRAPRVNGPVDARIVVPGSKSVTNRALVLAALADAPSHIVKPLRARDTELMARALYAMGTGVADRAGDWVITPAPLSGPAAVDAGLAGTVMRFVPPIAALADGPVHVDGDPRARERPLGPLVGALRALGANVDDGGRGALPLTVRGTQHLRGGPVTIDASASSQFVSALLLAGARFDKGVELRHHGGALPSLPHIAMSVAMLREVGVTVEDDAANLWRVLPGAVRARDHTVEPDLSNAAPFLAAALVTGGTVTVPDWPTATTQPGDGLRALFAELGGDVDLGPEGLTVRGTGTIHGIDADLCAESELTPVVAAVCALGDGPSRLRGIGHIRGHETDRLAALAHELSELGARVDETEDGLRIQPKPLQGKLFRSYADHRMAQAGAVIGLVVPGIEVDDIATTAKTLPDFVGMWDRLVGSAR